MESTLILVRHGATAANLANPAKLQGQTEDPPLSPQGLRQAELTRDLLRDERIVAVYTSPLRRAAETAGIITAPHGLEPSVIAELIECDVGRWAGRSWPEIAEAEPEVYRRFMDDPSVHCYAGGESFGDVYRRARDTIDALWDRHAGETFLAVSHHVVCRTVLAATLGLPLKEARRVSLDNCGVSVVTRTADDRPAVKSLNSAWHLSGRDG